MTDHLGDTPEVVQRVLRFAGKTRRDVRNPEITARECITLADWMTQALNRLEDLLKNDDPQAWKEAQRFVDQTRGRT